ncbi:MAG: dTMP kinase [Oligoflexia bacterium]|nr:dTMP kinase [Oligoflexia bacterium]
MRSTKITGFFITFEGTEGAGKSTLIREVAKRLELRGIAVTLTREPGGTSVAEKIRKVILEETMDPWTELFLYEAARAEHLAETVRPALSQGRVVLCDRFTDSTLAYQAHARGLSWTKVKALNRAATQGLQPQLTILVDVDPETGLRRARDPNRFEKEGVAFQEKVRAGFLKSRREQPRRWFTIRSESGSPAELAERVVREFLKRRGARHG